MKEILCVTENVNDDIWNAEQVWDIRGQSAILVWDMKEHEKAVTCFALSEEGDSLLSGSIDKTIRVW